MRGLVCRTPMEPAVTPSLALRYLRELSADLVAAAVADSAGEALAGSAELARAGARLVAHAPTTAGGFAAVQARGRDGIIVAVRSPEHIAVAVHTVHALSGLVRHDLLTILEDLAVTSRRPPDGALAPTHLDAGAPEARAAFAASRAPDSAL